MAFFFLILLLLVPLYFLSFSLISPYKRASSDVSSSPGNPQLPPGNTGWPLIGETMNYLLASKRGVPEKFVLERRNLYSTTVFKTSLFGESMAMLCTAEGNKFLFSNENKLVHSWWPITVVNMFAKPENSTHEEEAITMRKLLLPFLKPNALQNYVEKMDTFTKQFLQHHVCGRDIISFYPLARKFTLSLACQIFLNIEDQEAVAKLSRSILVVSSGFYSVPLNLPGTTYWHALRASKTARKVVETIIKEKSTHLLDKNLPPKQDLMSHFLLQMRNTGNSVNAKIIANDICGLLIGANDGVSATLLSVIKYLAELPEVYDRVFEEQMKIADSKGAGELLNWEDIKKMRYSRNVVCEVLRLLPPGLGSFRKAIADFTYEGFLIPKGFKLHWNANVTHMNPEYFPDPERFDPCRFEGKGPTPFSYVPFGGGPRMCPGNEYARLTLLVFIHNMVKGFKWQKMFPDEKIVYKPMLIPDKGLSIRLFPHQRIEE